MSDLAAPTSLLTPTPTAPTAVAAGSTISDARRAQIKKTADDFEASFLSEMFKPMFEGLSTDGPFGGGEAEGTWRSFMIDAMARQTVKAGGVGLSNVVMSEMIKMQEARQ
jgi:Rod binding domain-containing protein